jgi:hypothetical protein
MTKHTTGFLRRTGDAQRDNHVATIRGVEIYGDYGPASCGADADRIISCWNACVGMADPVAEIAALRAVAEAASEEVAKRLGPPEVAAAWAAMWRKHRQVDNTLLGLVDALAALKSGGTK